MAHHTDITSITEAHPVIASEARQSIFLVTARRTGLPRPAQTRNSIHNEEIGSASRIKWQAFLTGLILFVTFTSLCHAQPVLSDVKPDPSISQLVPLELHPGLNDVFFYGRHWISEGYKPGTSLLLGHYEPFQQPGQIFQVEDYGVRDTYIATVPWEKSPYFWVPLNDDGPNPQSLGDTDVLTTISVRAPDAGKPGQVQDILIQHVAFFQGLLNGQKQTFFVKANLHYIPGHPNNPFSKSLPVDIFIYGYTGGSDPYISPIFSLLDGFVTKHHYCDPEFAMLTILPIFPPPVQQIHDHKIDARQSLKPESCAK